MAKRKKRKQQNKKCMIKVKGGDRCGLPVLEGKKYCSKHKPIEYTHSIGETKFRGEKTVKTSEYDKYLQSDEWKEKAKAYKENNPNCSLCNRKENLNVHHRTYVRCGKEWPLDLIVLCKDCHQMFHNMYKYNGKTGHFVPK